MVNMVKILFRILLDSTIECKIVLVKQIIQGSGKFYNHLKLKDDRFYL